MHGARVLTAAWGRGGPEPQPARSPPGAAWLPSPQIPARAAGARRRPPAAAPLSAPRPAPSPARPPAQDHLTRAWLRPSPADPKGRGFLVPGPPPRQPAYPLAAADQSSGSPRRGWGCPAGYLARPFPPPAPTSSALPLFPLFCGLSHSLTPGHAVLFPIGSPQLQPLARGTCPFPGRV